MIYIEHKYNEHYRIALYNLPENIYWMLSNYFYDSSSIPENIYEVIQLEHLGKKNEDLIKLPDLLLVDVNEIIIDEIKDYCIKNFIQIIRITDIQDRFIMGDDIILSFSLKPIQKGELPNSMGKAITYFDYSMEIIKKLAQLSNTSKLQYISKQLLQQENKKINSNRGQILDVLTKLNDFIGLKDSYTKIHSEHVSKYAVLLGKELNLSSEQLELLRVGGLLHDIGKVGIPDAILRKKTSLSKTEFEIMKRHTVIGDAILSNTSYREIREMVRSHHEKIDGTGYPDKLKGDDIPYFARILSVVDTFDAMTTQRTYNKQKTLEEAFKELRRSSELRPNRYGKMCQQLDKNLVESFILSIRKNQNLMEQFRKKDIEIMAFRKQQAIENNESERKL